MKLRTYLTAAAFAAALFAVPVRGYAENGAPGATASGTNIQAARTSYCYAGSTVDPATGETIDYYNLCEDNLDVA